MDASGLDHPTDQTLRSYGAGQLHGDLAESVHSHLGFCADCRQRVAEFSGDTFLGRLRDGQFRPESPAPVSPSLAGLPISEGSPTSTDPPPTNSIPLGLSEHPDYEILGELGRGGMGVVYLAWNRLMGRKEVLKVVSRELMNRRRVLDRFHREIRNAAQLHHPNIVTAHSAFRAGENIVFAMEYVEGRDLATYVRGQGPLPVAYACNFTYQAALGLQYAHEKGMVHRDIKPSNLILARHGKRPVVKVLDFGLAKATHEGPVDKSLTHEGQMLGTPDYIAPEQSLDAAKADIRADIYSLGCTLHYLLTGGPPFQGASLYEVLQAHHSIEAKPLDVVRPDVPRDLAAVVGKMMAKDPAGRYQTPGDVAQELKQFFKQDGAAPARSKADVSGADEPANSHKLTRPKTETIQPPSGSAPASILEDSGIFRNLPEPAQPATSTARNAAQRSAAKPVGSNQAEPICRSLPAMEDRESVAAPAKPVAVAPGVARSRRLWPAAAGVLVLGLAIAWAIGVFNVKTKDGVIVLEHVPENAVVEVDGERAIVTPVGGEPVKIPAPPGKRFVVVKRNNDLLLGESVTLESGKSFKLAVRNIADNDGALVLEKLPANAVVEVDGKMVPVNSATGELVKIQISPGTHGLLVKLGNEVLLGESVTVESSRELKLRVPAKETAAKQPPALASAAVPPPAQQPSTAWTSPSTKMAFVRIKGGEFMMGSPESDVDANDDEKPQHKVRISPFLMGVTEVTRGQFRVFVDETGYKTEAEKDGEGGWGWNEETKEFEQDRRYTWQRQGFDQTDEHPVVNVSWNDAQAFITWLSRKEGETYRLPTEAEWEYACRAGTTSSYFCGNDPEGLAAVANIMDRTAKDNFPDYETIAARDGYVYTAPVGRFQANALALYDMHGNVWEWCADWYDAEYYKRSPVDDPPGPPGASRRVIRGGCWCYDPRRCRAACRNSFPSEYGFGGLGFRLALKLPGEIGLTPRSADGKTAASSGGDKARIESILERIRQPRRSELGEEVDKAIRDAVRFLKSNQRDDGSWTDIELEARTGMTSLVTLALISADEKPDSPTIHKALEYLRHFGPSELRSTYAISLQTMVFAAAEPQRDQSRIAASVRWLEQAQIKPDDRVLWPGAWSNSDTKRRPCDNSNSLIALLGLDAASEAGLPVKPEVWALAGTYWEKGQKTDGSWAYIPDSILSDNPNLTTSTSGMTCAGISSLIISGLRGYQRPECIQGESIQNCGKGAVNRNVHRGIDWLANHFKVGQNYGAGQEWRFCYLYGLERAGRLAGVRLFGEHDWYRLGADQLVHEQNKLSGFWRGALVEEDRVLATTFALLFLAKGRAPVLINKLRHAPVDDWQNDPDDVRNLVGIVSRDWKSLLTWQVIDPGVASVSDLLQAPIVFFNGHGVPEFSTTAKENFRKFVDQGGFIFADACCGSADFDKGFKKLMTDLFPEKDHELQPLPENHPIWLAKYQLDPKIYPLSGIQHGARTAVVYSPKDLSCYWNQAMDASSDPGVVKATQLGQNVIQYATGGKVAHDKLSSF